MEVSTYFIIDLLIAVVFLHASDTIGCGGEMVSKGTKWPCLTESTRTTTIIRIQFGCLKPYTKHPYMLIIPQLLTEDVL